MDSLKFKKELARLNKEQCQAVETIAGPVMVIAGPGTGKTQILTLRIANILLKTDAGPENILALTFTESAAANMRRRLVDLVGTPGYYVNISTFHGFCNRIIQDYPEKFPDIIGSTAATPLNQIEILRQVVDRSKLKMIKPIGNVYYYVPAVSKAIRDLKNEGLSHSDIKKLSASQKKNILGSNQTKKQKNDFLKTTQKNIELAEVYARYQNELRRRRLYDFEDMILKTSKVLQSDKDFLLDLQEKYQYILVDEHQDTNGAQNKVLELLTGYDENPNLFVVGDEKQAIFRFQGASIENFLYFKNKFPRVKLISLRQNYRSTQNILDGAHSLIERNATLATVKLESQTQKIGSKIKIGEFSVPESELSFLADRIKKLIGSAATPGEIAVLFRENKDALSIVETLSRKGIPFAVESDENILEDSEIKKLNVLFEAIEYFADPKYMAAALHLDFLGIEPIDIYRSLAPQAKPADSVEKIYKKIGDWKKLNLNINFQKFFETVARESGFLASLLGRPDYPAKISKLNSLFREIKKNTRTNHNYKLADYLKDIKILSEHNLAIKTKIISPKNSVRLMTAHKAKGLEFDYVFIYDARDGHWGNKRERNLFKLPAPALAGADSAAKASLAERRAEKNEDERRLFYMAVTRARKDVYITYSLTSIDGREQVPCLFISEIKPELKEKIPAKTYDEKAALEPNISLALTAASEPKIDEVDFVKEIFLKRGLSPTSLNNYLKCPWRFFYSNLLRLPQTPTLSQTYGLAKHFALQYFFNIRTSNVRLDIRCSSNLLVKKFISELKRFPLSKTDFELLAEKGKKSLKDYYDFYKNSWPANTINEYKIKGIDFSVGKEKIKLTGKLDKIETNPKNKIAVVTDYKTKKPETRNWILGQTKDSNGDYFRQLVFYKLLLDSMTHKKFNMEVGVIDFTEPFDSVQGKPQFKKEAFDIADSDVKRLREIIAQSSDEIINLKFWNKTCGQKDCEFCALRSLLN